MSTEALLVTQEEDTANAYKERETNTNIEFSSYINYKTKYKKERRSVERLKVSIECKVDIGNDKEAELIPGELLDISPVGFSFKLNTPTELNVDSFIKVIFNIGINYYALCGRIIWRNKISDTQVNYGCQMPVFNKQIEEFTKSKESGKIF